MAEQQPVDKPKSFQPFIYGLVDPLEPEHIRYVGMAVTHAIRPQEHVKEARNKKSSPNHRINWVRKLQSENREYSILILRKFSIGTLTSFVCAQEEFFIRSLRQAGHNLTNGTDGGEGAKGYKHTSETIQGLKDLWKKPRKTTKGRKISAEHLRKLIAGRKTPAVSKRMSDAQKKRFADPAQREIARKKALEQFADPVEREKQRIAAQAWNRVNLPKRSKTPKTPRQIIARVQYEKLLEANS